MKRLFVLIPFLFLFASCSSTSYEKVDELEFDVLVDDRYVSYEQVEQSVRINNFAYEKEYAIDTKRLEPVKVKEGDRIEIVEKRYGYEPSYIHITNESNPDLVLHAKNKKSVEVDTLLPPGIWKVTVKFDEPKDKMTANATFILKVLEPKS